MKTNLFYYARLAVLAAFVFNLSCEKDKNNTDQSGNTENNPPQITITSPTDNFSFLSPSNNVTIKGCASDDGTITSITWKSDQGQSGTASGTTDWQAGNISLNNGDNLFTFVATDESNLTDTATLLITFDQYQVFLSKPRLSPEGVLVDHSTNVKINISILNNTYLVDNSIKLLQVDQQGNVIREICQLYDDGYLYHGDDILNDGIYSNIENFTENDSKDIFVRVVASLNLSGSNLETYSEIRPLHIISELSQDEVHEMFDMQETGDTKFWQLVQSMNKDEALKNTIDYLKSQSVVEDAGITPSGDIWIKYNYGTQGMIMTTEEGNEGGGAIIPKRDSLPTIPLSQQTRGINNLAQSAFKSGKSTFSSGEDENIVLDKDVLLFAPNWTQFNGWGTEFLDNLYTIIEDSECPSFTIHYVKNANANLTVLKTLSQYGLIVIHTHGGVDEGNNVMFMTGQEVNYVSADVIDWLLDRIMSVTVHGKTYWAAKPSFITAYNSNFPNSIVYNGSCESAHNNTMSNAFINNGANVYYGFSKTVRSWFDRDMAYQLFPKLITQGKTSHAAFTANQHDDNTPAAYFVMQSNIETHFASDFTNGDFEQGNLSGWNGDGDGRVITQLGYYSPENGSYMGIISTGLGYTTATGSISQNFCVPADATSLSLRWNFISEEFMEWVGSLYQDYFQISIIDDMEVEHIILYKSIDIINDQYGLAYVSPNIAFDKGGVYATGWINATFDVSSYAGKNITLILAAGDVGDSSYDTAILLDDIKVE